MARVLSEWTKAIGDNEGLGNKNAFEARFINEPSIKRYIFVKIKAERIFEPQLTDC